MEQQRALVLCRARVSRITLLALAVSAACVTLTCPSVRAKHDLSLSLPLPLTHIPSVFLPLSLYLSLSRALPPSHDLSLKLPAIPLVAPFSAPVCTPVSIPAGPRFFPLPIGAPPREAARTIESNEIPLSRVINIDYNRLYLLGRVEPPSCSLSALSVPGSLVRSRPLTSRSFQPALRRPTRLVARRLT